MYISSRLIMSEKNINATQEFLEKAKVFHHLWQPDEEIKDIKRAIKIHKTAEHHKKIDKEQL